MFGDIMLYIYKKKTTAKIKQGPVRDQVSQWRYVGYSIKQVDQNVIYWESVILVKRQDNQAYVQGKNILAMGEASAKALVWVHTWLAPRTVRRLLWVK